MQHRLMWLEIAEQQYLDLSPTQLDAADACLARLVHDPTGAPHTPYDDRSDQWSVPIGNRGFLLYAVVAQSPPTLIVLRLIVDA